jgi:hypothetical protein
MKIDDFVLNYDNPRISHADQQLEARQKVAKEQKSKLVKLAQRIAEHAFTQWTGCSRRLNQQPECFIALEASRQVRPANGWHAYRLTSAFHNESQGRYDDA